MPVFKNIHFVYKFIFYKKYKQKKYFFTNSNFLHTNSHTNTPNTHLINF